MKLATLQRYYQRLLKYPVKQDLQLSLAEVAECLVATPRHSRTVLNQMAERGWLTWRASAGRGKRATLNLRFDQAALKLHLAEQAIIAGQHQQALQLLEDDQQSFGRLLVRHTGVSNQQGVVSLRLTYPRGFAPLYPHLPQRNAERFFCRQLYSGLVQCNPQGEISADLCHCWESFEQATRWRFHLRPALRFQDGAVIDAETVANYLQALKGLAAYQKELAHLVSCEAISELCLELKLSASDKGLAGLLADPKYLIQPIQQLQASEHEQVSGSGPFSLSHYAEDYIELAASNDYYGARALADRVQVWKVSNQQETSSPTAQFLIAGRVAANEPEHDDLRRHSRKESGCQILVFNHQAQLSEAQRRYLSSLLGPKALLSYFNKQEQELGLSRAENLLPDWRARLQLEAKPSPLPKQLTLAYFDHQDLEQYAAAYQAILAEQGCELLLYSFNYQQYMNKAYAQQLEQDLLLDAVNLDENRPSSALRWLGANPVLALAMNEPLRALVKAQLSQIQAQLDLADYLPALEATANLLQEQCLVVPLFHHWQSLRFGGSYRGVRMSDWGWPRIKDIWVRPEG